MAGCLAIPGRGERRGSSSGSRASDSCKRRSARNLRPSGSEPCPNMNKVTLTVEIVVEIEDYVEPNDVTFDIDLEKIRPMVGNKYVGRILGYCTQEYVGE